MNPLSEGNSLSHYRTSNYIAKSILFPIGEEPLMVLLQVSGKLLKKSCVCVFFFLLQVLSMQSKALPY